MNNEIIIDDVQQADFDEWRRLWDAYNAFYGREGSTSLPLDITRATWARFLDPSEPMSALVAKSMGQMVGIAHYLYHRSTTSLAPNCYLQDLYTCEDRRSQGIGRSLIGEVFRRARAVECNGIYWQTHKSNAIAMQLYDKVGQQSEFLIYKMTAPVLPESVGNAVIEAC